MGSAHFAVSDTGTLVYVPRPLLEYELVVFDRGGQARVLAIPRSDYDQVLRFSHDGRYVAASEEFRHIYLYDLERDSFTAIPTGGDGVFPLWTPDDNRLIFSSIRGVSYDLFSMPVDGSGPAELLLDNSRFKWATSISSNGRVLLYQEQTSGSSWDIMELSLEGDAEHATLVGGPGLQTGAVFSPNERFFAYTSEESGQNEVYVRPYPDHLDWRKTISTESGWAPVWSADGRELFYLQGNRLMVVPITTEPVFSFGLPRMLFEQEFAAGDGYSPAPYDISPDGERFVFRRVSRELPGSLYMKLNWFEELKRLVPTGR